MKNKYSLLLFLGLLIPAFLAFRYLFLPGPAVWGDAPYFYGEKLRELVSEPYAWVGSGGSLGEENDILWIYPILFLFGLFHNILGLGNSILIRAFFYFPAIILSFLGPFLLAHCLGYRKIVQFFTSLVYGLNTYFLLLIDGGQVGVALAYGLFPFAFLSLYKLINKLSFRQFFASLAVFMLLVMADVRMAIIALISFILWFVVKQLVVQHKVEIHKLIVFLPFGFSVLGLSSYWLVPILQLRSSPAAGDISNLQLISLLNPFLLFQPHWPLNEFGKVFAPPFYFVGIPLLIFGSLLLRAKKDSLHLTSYSLMLIYLLLALLAKGSSPPFGLWYDWMVTNLPFGFAFRDSTKFFAPLILFAALLIGWTIESFVKARKRKYLAYSFQVVIYLYLLFLVYPALMGNLNGVLARRDVSEDFRLIHDKVSEGEFFRTVWFPERHPSSFQTEEKPALDAKSLISYRPFATMNAGTFDKFNFLHNQSFLDWFDLLSMKYLFFSGDSRVKEMSEEERRLESDLLERVATISALVKTDWGTDIPIYEVPDVKPRMFAVDKLIAVVGSDNIYEKIEDIDADFSVGNQGFVFFEDGKFDPRYLESVNPESTIIVLNEKDKTDLAMSFLQEHFVGPQEAKESSWAIYRSGDYLTYKYQLLIRDLKFNEFDYDRGVAFSTETGEHLVFDLPAQKDGEHYLAIRSMSREVEDCVEYEFNQIPDGDILNKQEIFNWFLSVIQAKKGKNRLVIKNKKGMNIINVVALIPKNEFDEALNFADTFVKHIGAIKVDELGEFINKNVWYEFDFEKVSPVRYKIAIPQSANWIVFTDSYHPKWKLRKDGLVHGSLPVYSMLNGFYVDPDWVEAEVFFEGQKGVRWGLYFSALSIFALAIVSLWFYTKKK